MTARNPHRYTCPGCGEEVVAVAAHHARQRTLCRPCIRRVNGWACGGCGSSDPHHPSPCPSSPSITAGPIVVPKVCIAHDHQ